MKVHNLIGGAWLAAHTGVELVMPLAVQSRIGGRRSTHVAAGMTTETYVESMRPSDDLRGHLTFHFKHEVLHLELLSRVFNQIDPQELALSIGALVEAVEKPVHARGMTLTYGLRHDRCIRQRVPVSQAPHQDRVGGPVAWTR